MAYAVINKDTNDIICICKSLPDTVPHITSNTKLSSLLPIYGFNNNETSNKEVSLLTTNEEVPKSSTNNTEYNNDIMDTSDD
jgi:hypothetical protein